MGLSVAEKIRLIMKRQKITMGDLAEASGSRLNACYVYPRRCAS